MYDSVKALKGGRRAALLALAGLYLASLSFFTAGRDAPPAPEVRPRPRQPRRRPTAR
jgi:hypothetical protein